MDGSAALVITTMLTPWLAKVFKLDWSQTGGLTLLLGIAARKVDVFVSNWDVSSINFYDLLWNTFVFISMVACGLGLVFYGYTRYIEMQNKKKFKMGPYRECTLNLYTKTSIDHFLKYLSQNPEMCTSKSNNLNYGDLAMLARSYAETTTDKKISNEKESQEIKNRAFLTKPPLETVVEFTDTNFDVYGSYTWKETEQKVQTMHGSNLVEQVVKCPWIELCVYTTSKKLPDASRYIDKIQEWNQLESTKMFHLYSVKVMQKTDGSIIRCCTPTYTGPKLGLDVLEKRYIEPFFQPQKKQIWSLIKTIDQTPELILNKGQFPQAGFLLYGPPGTGKSSFAYRTAMTLNRHVVSLDIRTFKTRAELYQYIREPCVNGEWVPAAKVVFVFDEFDLTVKELVRRQDSNLKSQKSWFDKIWSTNPTTSAPKNNNDDAESESDGKTKTTATPKFRFDPEDEIQLNDLLELLQGVIPSHKSLIFATTNHFDELKVHCPALFRPGRLTPILFDNFDTTMIDEFVKYHFPDVVTKTLVVDQKLEKIQICPSALAEALSESASHLDRQTQYNVFQKRLDSLFMGAVIDANVKVLSSLGK